MSYDKARFEAAHARLRQAPLELTDADLAQLAIVDPKFDIEGREARTQAQLALIQKNLPALQTKQTPGLTPRALTVKHLDAFADQFGDVLIDVLKQTVRPLREQVKVLEARLAQLETKPFVKFCGTFEGGKSYQPGDAVVHQSALWICKAATSGTPSKDFVGWQLALKRGDAGR